MLYDIYMKLEAKAEEAIGVEEEITYLKHENFLKEVEERREKRRDIAFKTMTLQQKYNQESSQLAEQERRVQELEQTVLTLELSVQQSEVFVQRVEANMRQNCEQDYNIM